MYKNQLDKAWFANDAVSSESKDFSSSVNHTTITIHHHHHHWPYEIARNRLEIASLVYKLFDKNAGSGETLNEHLAEELRKTVTKKIPKKKSLCEI